MRWMYAKFAGVSLLPHYHINVDKEFKADCLMWLEFLRQPNSICRPFIDFPSKLMVDEIIFFTDASGAEHLGFGGTFENDWTYSMWESDFIHTFRPNIEYLQLYTMAVAIELWAHKLCNRRVVIFCAE